MKLTKLQEEAIQLVAWADERPAEQVLAFVIEQGLTFAYGSVHCSEIRVHEACADSLADEIAAERMKTFGQSKPTKK
jgi:hypothetical protein